jgi:hypothetical protein
MALSTAAHRGISYHWTPLYADTDVGKLFDDNGRSIRAADIDVFRSDDYVLVVERDGKLQELRKQRPGKNSG